MPVFDADAMSIYDLFTDEANVLGLRVPEYQRTYDWGEENLQRLFEDVLSGLRALIDDPNALTFLGTIILFDERDSRESTFDGTSFAVIDGQQRLTTCALLAVQLHDSIAAAMDALTGVPDEISEWLQAEKLAISKKLQNCIFGNLLPDGISTYPFPRIIRERNDVRAPTEFDKDYGSTIAQYLDDYAHHILEGGRPPYVFSRDNAEGSVERFLGNVSTIQRFIVEIKETNDDSSSDLSFDPLLSTHFERSGVRKLFSKLPTDQREQNRLVSNATHNFGDQTQQILRLITFAAFVMQSVIVTRVIAREERYAFDIFDALNTTGEPLSAIETFKPQVVRFENQQSGRGYAGSESEMAYRDIEACIERFTKNADKQDESRDIVIPFSLYMTGQKETRQLSTQRRYLQSCYGRIDRDGGSEESVKSSKRQFVKNLADIADYRKRYWKNGKINIELGQLVDRDQVLMALALISSMNNSLTIPILCRYYVAGRESARWDDFGSAVKALTAFVVLRRSATGGTAGIDSDLRAVMSRGRPAPSSENGLMRGVLSDRPLTAVSELRTYLREWLARKPAYVTDKDSWKEKASAQGIYSSSKPLSKFMLLAAAHNSRQVEANPWLLQKSRNSTELDYLNYGQWASEDFETIEHIAPQRDPDRNWDRDIYTEGTLKDSLGNLTLLPKDPNSAVGNRPWQQKRLFYGAFAAETSAEVHAAIEAAEGNGISFGRTKEMLLSMRHLPIARTIAVAEEWGSDRIKERTSNLLDLVWEEVSPWLFDD